MSRKEKKASVFKRFWRWLTGSRSPRNETPNGHADKPASEPKAAREIAIPQLQESLPENPYGDRLYKRLEERKEPLPAGGVGAAGDFCVYEYCGVVFPKADIVYHYINAGENIQVGDRVLVPVWVHGEHKQAVGIVVSVGQYLNRCLPRPLQQTKYIIKKL